MNKRYEEYFTRMTKVDDNAAKLSMLAKEIAFDNKLSVEKKERLLNRINDEVERLTYGMCKLHWNKNDLY